MIVPRNLQILSSFNEGSLGPRRIKKSHEHNITHRYMLEHNYLIMKGQAL